jgi:hypothetical protein
MRLRTITDYTPRLGDGQVGKLSHSQFAGEGSGGGMGSGMGKGVEFGRILTGDGGGKWRVHMSTGITEGETE